jgi:hypothetical protein
MDRKDIDAAIKVGIEAYLHHKAKGDERLSRGALNLIYVAISQLTEKTVEASALACTFCGGNACETRFAVGSDACICADCVGLLHKALRRRAA